jgi:putative ribosome biogenesis GTPase RsgA
LESPAFSLQAREGVNTSTSFISTNLGLIEGIALLIILLVEPDGVAGAVDRLLGRRTDLCGFNGAGKSTLFNLLAGSVRADAGLRGIEQG